ncbi:MAG: hypothetical protein ACLQHM_03090, partial [Limisphaerales bacterium]
MRRRVFFIANGLFDNQLAGGDVHLLHSIQAVTEAGWEPEYLSTRELEQHLKSWRLPANVTFSISAFNALTLTPSLSALLLGREHGEKSWLFKQVD